MNLSACMIKKKKGDLSGLKSWNAVTMEAAGENSEDTTILRLTATPECVLQRLMPQSSTVVERLCVSYAELRRSPTCAGVYEDNDAPIFLDMRRQISITVAVTGGSSLESSVDPLSQGLRSGLTDGWRAVLLLQAGSLQPSRPHVLDVLMLPSCLLGRLSRPLCWLTQ